MRTRVSAWRVWAQLGTAAIVCSAVALIVTFIASVRNAGTPADRALGVLLTAGVGEDLERIQTADHPREVAKDVAESLGVRAVWAQRESASSEPGLEVRPAGAFVVTPMAVGGIDHVLELGPFREVVPTWRDGIRTLVPGLIVSGLLAGLVAVPSIRRMNRVLYTIDLLAEQRAPALLPVGSGPAGVVETQVNALARAQRRHATEMRQTLEQLEAERQLAEEAREAAVAARRTGQRFLAEMSHELRTPLNAIIGYSQLLREDVAASFLGDLDRIEQAGHHLLGLVDELLDLAKVEQGMMEFDVRPIALQSLCDTVIDMARALPRSPDVELLGPRVHSTVSLDPHRVRQILLNLLSNALRYTQRGTVEITVDLTDASLRLTVHDTGVGMSNDDLEAVFEPFRQAAHTSPGSGTGLGLPVSRALARAMNGDLTARSQPGKGSSFTLILPRSLPPHSFCAEPMEG